eukprot:6260993-Prymnesium_polylepis.1
MHDATKIERKRVLRSLAALEGWPSNTSGSLSHTEAKSRGVIVERASLSSRHAHTLRPPPTAQAHPGWGAHTATHPPLAPVTSLPDMPNSDRMHGITGAR